MTEMREWRVVQDGPFYKRDGPIQINMDSEETARGRQAVLDANGMGTKVVAIESRVVGPWEVVAHES